MGTRSLTVFIDDNKELCVMFKHWDSHLESYGLDLAQFLAKKNIVKITAKANIIKI